MRWHNELNWHITTQPTMCNWAYRLQRSWAETLKWTELTHCSWAYELQLSLWIAAELTDWGDRTQLSWQIMTEWTNCSWANGLQLGHYFIAELQPSGQPLIELYSWADILQLKRHFNNMDSTGKADDWTQLQGLVAQIQNTHISAKQKNNGGMSKLLAIAALLVQPSKHDPTITVRSPRSKYMEI